jgi:hypothetical protein
MTESLYEHGRLTHSPRDITRRFRRHGSRCTYLRRSNRDYQKFLSGGALQGPIHPKSGTGDTYREEPYRDESPTYVACRVVPTPVERTTLRCRQHVRTTPRGFCSPPPGSFASYCQQMSGPPLALSHCCPRLMRCLTLFVVGHV